MILVLILSPTGFSGWFEILTHAPLEHPVQDLATLPVILRVILMISMVMLVISLVIPVILMEAKGNLEQYLLMTLVLLVLMVAMKAVE